MEGINGSDEGFVLIRDGYEQGSPVRRFEMNVEETLQLLAELREKDHAGLHVVGYEKAGIRPEEYSLTLEDPSELQRSMETALSELQSVRCR